MRVTHLIDIALVLRVSPGPEYCQGCFVDTVPLHGYLWCFAKWEILVLYVG